MEFRSFFFISKLVKILLVGILGTIIFFTSNIAKADPPGRITFLGITADGQRSVWLSLTTAGMFEVQARNTTVDQWTQSERGLHVTFSPFVSNGSGDPHSLFQVINGNLVFIDKDNQQGGITFPPFPGGTPPGEPANPIILPGEPTHPIEIPGEPSPPTGSSSDQGSNRQGSNNVALTNRAPLTTGREFAKEPTWNIWIDSRYFDIRDHRFELDRNGSTTNTTIGADRRVNDELAIGCMLANNAGKSGCFNNNWKTNTKGFAVGPYFGYRFLPNWGIEGILAYGQYENKNSIAILNSKYTTTFFSTAFIATGVYTLGKIQLRPKPAIFYNYFNNARYNLNATVNGALFLIPISAYHFSFGFSRFSLEALRYFELPNGKLTLAPYVELGIDYAFVRPNNGKILTGNLTMKRSSPFSGLTRLGMRTFISRSIFIETSASYLSIGQKNLNIWEGRIMLSLALD